MSKNDTKLLTKDRTESFFKVLQVSVSTNIFNHVGQYASNLGVQIRDNVNKFFAIVDYSHKAELRYVLIKSRLIWCKELEQERLCSLHEKKATLDKRHLLFQYE